MDKSLFERLDLLEQQNCDNETKLNEILNILDEIKTNKDKENQPKKKISERETISRFAKASNKYYLWFGPKNEFDKSKRLCNLVCVALIIISVLSTFFTIGVLKEYSFTVFENVWTVFVCIFYAYCRNSKKIMKDNDLKDRSCDIFFQNGDGTWCTTNKEKKRFKVFRRIAYVAVVLNIILIWTKASGTLAIIATILEVLFFVLSIVLVFLREDLFCMYCVVLYTGKKIGSDDIATIVFFMNDKKVLMFDEFKSKYGQLIDCDTRLFQ